MTVVRMSEATPHGNSFAALAALDQAALDALPEAVYLCAGDGRVIRFNRKAAELWGRAPKVDDPEERFCGSSRLYRLDGTWLPHDQCPMAAALQTGASFHQQEVVVEQPDGLRRTVLVNIAPLTDGEGRVTGAVNCFQDISERRQAEERQRLLVAELNHRIKNTLATVHSMAVTTARNATSVDDFTSSFEARLLALSQAHALLTDGNEVGARLHDLLAQQLEAFAGGGEPRVRFDGPEVYLEPRVALSLGMVFHELMTNAAKYGPLSVADGKIAIVWALLPGSGDGRVLALQWSESGGPRVKAPQRTGFGTRLIKRTVAGGLGGEADLRFEPSGLELSLRIPLRDPAAAGTAGAASAPPESAAVVADPVQTA